MPFGGIHVHRYRRFNSSQHDYGIVSRARAGLTSACGAAARHVHARRALPRKISGCDGRGDQRSGTRRARHSDSRRFARGRRPGRPRVASLSAPALGRLRRRHAPAGGDHGAMAALSSRHAAQRNLHRLALAARCRQDRAPPARLPKTLAHRAGKNAQAGEVRHLLLAGDGALPRYPHAEIQRQARSHLGHGRRDEQGTARPARRRMPLHPDRRADVSFHGQHLRQGSRRSEIHDRRLQPRSRRASTTSSCGFTPAGAIRTCSA